VQFSPKEDVGLAGELRHQISDILLFGHCLLLII